MGRFIGLAAAPVMAAAIGYTVGTGISALLQKHVYDIQFKQVSLKQTTDQAVAQVLRRASISGDVHAVRESLIRARGMYLKDGLNLAQADDKIANKVKGLADVVGLMRFTKKASESTMGPTAKEADDFERMTEAQQELIDIAAQQRDNAVETRKIQERHAKRMEEAVQQQHTDSLLERAVKALDFLDPRAAWDFDYFSRKSYK